MIREMVAILALAFSGGDPHAQVRLHGSRAPVDPDLKVAAPYERISDIVVRDGWVQEAPPSEKVTAAYMVIENHTKAEISLTHATSTVIEVIEMHKMEQVNGLMKMRRIESITVPPESEVALKPGGYHLMVIGTKRALKDGDMVPITLEFSNGLQQAIELPVKPMSRMLRRDQ